MFGADRQLRSSLHIRRVGLRAEEVRVFISLVPIVCVCVCVKEREGFSVLGERIVESLKGNHRLGCFKNSYRQGRNKVLMYVCIESTYENC